eukprot:4646998-Prymnesium_polylepis.1
MNIFATQTTSADSGWDSSCAARPLPLPMPNPAMNLPYSASSTHTCVESPFAGTACERGAAA